VKLSAAAIAAAVSFAAAAQDAPRTAMPKDPAAWAQRAKATLMRNLKDPASARFRESFVSAQNVGGTMRPALCGQINSKNSHGGYGGFQRFVVTSSGAMLEEELEGGFSFLWDDACGWKIRVIDK
jgi:hypothetical protein